MKEAIVLSDGVIENNAFLGNFLDGREGAFLVCADGAVRHLASTGRVPAAIVGDMDSADPEEIARFRARGSEILVYPKDKDKTDTQLAVELAIDRGYRTVSLLGALGGRIDHALANISLLFLGKKRDARIRIVEPSCELYLLSGSEVLEGEPGQTVSLLPIAEAARGITLTGFRYPLSDGTLEMGNPFTISNRLAEARGTVTVREGTVLVVRYFIKAT